MDIMDIMDIILVLLFGQSGYDVKVLTAPSGVKEYSHMCVRGVVTITERSSEYTEPLKHA